MPIPINFEGNSTDLTVSFNTPIMNINKKYVVSFDRFECDNAFANVDESNNIFRYSTDSGANWKDLKIQTGAYEIETLNKEIRRLMYDNGDYNTTAKTLDKRFYIILSHNEASQHSVILISNTEYQVDFTIPNTIGEMLGFGEEILKKPYNESRGGIKMDKIDSILVNTNITSGGYFNNTKRPYIFRFNPNKVAPGFRIFLESNNVKYFPVTNTGLTDFRVWLEDKDGNVLKFLHAVNNMVLSLELEEVRE